MSQSVEIQPKQVSKNLNFFQPKSFEDILETSRILVKSSFLPKAYMSSNKTAEQRVYDVFAAIQLGAELGLSPMVSLQSIAVINGMPTVYGDVQLSLVRASGKLEYFEEYFEGQKGTDNFLAGCKAKRFGEKTIVSWEFSVSDAKKAGLWGKMGPWTTHPERMLRYKARSFVLRDGFADIIKGIHSHEEMEGETIDLNYSRVTNKNRSVIATNVDINKKGDDNSKSSPHAEQSSPKPIKQEKIIITYDDVVAQINIINDENFRVQYDQIRALLKSAKDSNSIPEKELKELNDKAAEKFYPYVKKAKAKEFGLKEPVKSEQPVTA